MSSKVLTLLLLLLLLHTLTTPSTSIGINYGQVADNLPPPTSTIPLLRSIGADKVKLYDSDPTVLRAFAGTGTQFVIGIPSDSIPTFSASPSSASAWVKSNLKPYIQSTNITAVTVGNEVLTGNNTAMMDGLVPAMEAVWEAVKEEGLDGSVKVTTAHSLAVLASSYPPSNSKFREDLKPYVSKMLEFLKKTDAPFFINAYPYFAYKDDPSSIPLEYVVFESNQGNVDGNTKLRYENMLFAQVDAVYAAVEDIMGKEKAGDVEVVVSETGWPSKGDEDEAGATPENAEKYNGNLIKLVEEKKGTPMRPDTPLEVYVFALFNENSKPGPASERNYGLFKPDGSPAYPLGIKLATNSSGGGGAGGGDGGGGDSEGGGVIVGPGSPLSSAGYFVSSADKLDYSPLNIFNFLLAAAGIRCVLFLEAW